jgi:hypothetical protein
MRHHKTHRLALVLGLALALTILVAPSRAAIDPRIGYVEREAGTAQAEPALPAVRQTIVREDGFGWAEAGTGAGLALGAAVLLGGSALALREPLSRTLARTSRPTRQSRPERSSPCKHHSR